MKKLIIAALLALSCATVNKYAYSGVMTKPECESQCASYGYPVIGVQDGVCICDTSACGRPAGHGGCEHLPEKPAN